MATSRATPYHLDAIKILARAGYGALGLILETSWSGLLLGTMIVGLLGFALWRSIKVIKDTDHHGAGANGSLWSVCFRDL